MEALATALSDHPLGSQPSFLGLGDEVASPRDFPQDPSLLYCSPETIHQRLWAFSLAKPHICHRVHIYNGVWPSLTQIPSILLFLGSRGLPKCGGQRQQGRDRGGNGYAKEIRSASEWEDIRTNVRTLDSLLAQIYIFGIVVRSVGDGWAASCPSLKKYGAFTLGVSREEVLNEMHRVVQQIVEALAREKNPYPRISSGDYLFFLGDLPVLGSANGRLYQKRSFLRCFSSSLLPSRIFLPRTPPKLGIEEVDVKVVIGTRH